MAVISQTDGSIIINTLNDFFIIIGTNVAGKNPNVDLPCTYLLYGPNINKWYFALWSSRLWNMLDLGSLTNNAEGYNDINAYLLTILSTVKVEPLMHLCDTSSTEDVLPTELQLANAIPLCKSDDSRVLKLSICVCAMCYIIGLWKMYLQQTPRIPCNIQNRHVWKLHSAYMDLITIMDWFMTRP